MKFDDLDALEERDKNESLEDIQKEIEFDKQRTLVSKTKFIDIIKTGLGEEIKKNPNGIRIIENKWHEKLGLFLKKIFTKF